MFTEFTEWLKSLIKSQSSDFSDWSKCFSLIGLIFVYKNPLTRAMSSNMGFTVNWSVGLTALFMLLICVSMILCDEVKSFDFDVKPGGARNHFETEQWVCNKFHYCFCFGRENSLMFDILTDQSNLMRLQVCFSASGQKKILFADRLLRSVGKKN